MAEILDPLFEISPNYMEMRSRYKKLLRKNEEWRREHDIRNAKGECWEFFYVELVRKMNRRGEYRCW